MNTYKKRENVENVHSGKMDWEPPNQNISIRESEVHFKWRGWFSLPTNAEHSGKVIEEEYTDPKEKPSNQENTESLSTGTDTTGDLTAEGQAVPSELSSSHKTMESLLTSADKTGEFTTEEYPNPKVMKLSNQNMVETLTISTEKTGEITAEGQAVLNELSSNQKTRESSPTIEE